MKKKALDFMGKVYLRKRSVIKSVNDVLKNTYPMEHSKHRSLDNFLGNLIAALIAYPFLDTKPSIKTQRFLPNYGNSLNRTHVNLPIKYPLGVIIWDKKTIRYWLRYWKYSILNLKKNIHIKHRKKYLTVLEVVISWNGELQYKSSIGGIQKMSDLEVSALYERSAYLITKKN